MVHVCYRVCRGAGAGLSALGLLEQWVPGLGQARAAAVPGKANTSCRGVGGI